LKHIDGVHNRYQRDDLEVGHPYVEPEYIGNDEGNGFKVTLLDEEKALFLFVHTMIALKDDHYFDIQEFSYGTTEIFDLYDRGFLFQIKLKSNKEGVTEQKFLEGYDEKYHLLRFAGQEIELAKKGKETDAVLLLKTLLKAKNAEWKHNDEILSDWGYNDEHQKRVPKNKVYFAGREVNNAVALKTQIKDFLEFNTSKARINPKYKKVDE